MKQQNNELESLLDKDQYISQKRFDKTFIFQQPKTKSNDLYDSLISTGNFNLFFSQLEGKQDFEKQFEQIDLLEQFDSKPKKRGRPKKTEVAKLDDQYNQQELQYQVENEIQVQRIKNKNRRKKQKGVVKGNTKNMLMFMQKLILDYLSKYVNIQNLKKLKKESLNRLQFYSLLKNVAHKTIITEMFQDRYLNRQIVKSRLDYNSKIVYLKKVKTLQNAFYGRLTVTN